jgi:hypothetical protein
MGTQIRGGRADSSHVVSTQRPGPGGVSATVLVDLAPIRRDTVRVTIVDTLRIRVVDTLRLTRFDTLFVDRVVQDTVFVDRVRTVSDTTRDTVFIERVSGDTSAGNSAGSNDCIPLFVVGLATLGGLGLGGLGASRILPRLRPPPSTRPGGSSPPADNAVPERDPKSLDVSAFDPVVIDEAVWVTHGTAHTRERES